jgi:amino acid permease
VVVSVIESQHDEIEKAQVHNIVLASILTTTKCIGIYHLSQQLIIPSKAFLEIAQKVKNSDLPNWD